MAEQKTANSFVALSPAKDNCTETFAEIKSKGRLPQCQAMRAINPVQFPILFGDADYPPGSFQTPFSLAVRIQKGMIAQINNELSGLSHTAKQEQANLKRELAQIGTSTFRQAIERDIDRHVKEHWPRDIYGPEVPPRLGDVKNLHSINLRSLPAIEKFFSNNGVRADRAENAHYARLQAHDKYEIRWLETPIVATGRRELVHTPTPEARTLSSPRLEISKSGTQKPKPFVLPERRNQGKETITIETPPPAIKTPLDPVPSSILGRGKQLISVVLDSARKLARNAHEPDPSVTEILQPATVAGLINFFFNEVYDKPFMEKFLAKARSKHEGAEFERIKRNFSEDLKRDLLGVIGQESWFDSSIQNFLGDAGLGQFKFKSAKGIIQANTKFIDETLRDLDETGFKSYRRVNFYGDKHLSEDPSLKIRYDGPASILMMMLYIKDNLQRHGNIENAFLAYHHGDAAVEIHNGRNFQLKNKEEQRIKDVHTVAHAVYDPDLTYNNRPRIRVSVGDNKFVEVPWDGHYYRRVSEMGSAVLKGKRFSEFSLLEKGQLSKAIRSCLLSEGEAKACQGPTWSFPRPEGKGAEKRFKALLSEAKAQHRPAAAPPLRTRGSSED